MLDILEKPYSAIVMSLISHESSIFEMLHNMISRIIHFGIFMCNFILRYTCDVDIPRINKSVAQILSYLDFHDFLLKSIQYITSEPNDHILQNCVDM